MYGKKLIIPNITSFTGPKVYDDPIMSSGSLLLFDPTHTSGGDSAGNVSGGVLTNIAATISAGITGLSVSNSRPVITNTNPANMIPAIKQRTAKGGLYGLWSHTSGLTAINSFGVNADFLRQYMFDNSDNAFFVSIWVRSLRRSIQGNQNAPMPLGILARQSSPSGSTLFELRGNNMSYALGQRNVGQNVYNTLWDTDAPRLINLGRQTWNGNNTEKPESASLVSGPIFTLGSVFGYSGANVPGVSGIIERIYIEDLTISGRTYAEVDAIDFSMFNTAHAPGGKWYGDTYPDPSTFP